MNIGHFDADRGYGNLVKVVVAGAHHSVHGATKIDEFCARRSRCRSPWWAQRADRALEKEHEPVLFLRSRWRRRVMAGLSLKRLKRENARRETEGKRKRKRVARRVELYRSRWGADTDRACYRPQFKSNLRHDRISWSRVAWFLPVNGRARIENRLTDRSWSSHTCVECRSRSIELDKGRCASSSVRTRNSGSISGRSREGIKSTVSSDRLTDQWWHESSLRTVRYIIVPRRDEWSDRYERSCDRARKLTGDDLTIALVAFDPGSSHDERQAKSVERPGWARY